MLDTSRANNSIPKKQTWCLQENKCWGACRTQKKKDAMGCSYLQRVQLRVQLRVQRVPQQQVLQQRELQSPSWA
jgi:hypothetical protein